MANAARPLTPHASPRDYFGAELRRLRERAGLSTSQLGDLVHYSGDLIAKVEKAERWPKPELATALDTALHTDGTFARLLPLLEAQRAAHHGDLIPVGALVDSTVGTSNPTVDRPWRDVQAPAETAADIANGLVELFRHERISTADLRHLSLLTGQVVDLDYRILIDIAHDGAATLHMDHTVLNLTNRPVARLVRDFWFEHTDGRLTPMPQEAQGGQLVAIQRIHDTPNLTKFACQLSPPLQPGASAALRYSCAGGRFADALYWRHSLTRFALTFTLAVRHRGARPLLQCSATEEFPDGSEVSATEDLAWRYEGDDVLLTLTRAFLRPNQALTLRWEATSDAARQG